MALNISNTTKQHIVFNFVQPVPDSYLLSQVEIPSGEQREIGHGWSHDQIDRVIKQLEASFGARNAAEAHRHIDKFSGLLWRDTGVVSEDEIIMGHDSVVDHQQRRSAAEASKAALGFDHAVNKTDNRGGTRRAKSTQIEVHQESLPNTRRTGDEVEFVLGVDTEGTQQLKLPT